MGAELLASPAALARRAGGGPGAGDRAARTARARSCTRWSDWPGHRARAPELLAVLVEFGADVNAPFGGPQHDETPAALGRERRRRRHGRRAARRGRRPRGARRHDRGRDGAGRRGRLRAVARRGAPARARRGPGAWIEERAAGFDSVADLGPQRLWLAAAWRSARVARAGSSAASGEHTGGRRVKQTNASRWPA